MCIAVRFGRLWIGRSLWLQLQRMIYTILIRFSNSIPVSPYIKIDHGSHAVRSLPFIPVMKNEKKTNLLKENIHTGRVHLHYHSL